MSMEDDFDIYGDDDFGSGPVNEVSSSSFSEVPHAFAHYSPLLRPQSMNSTQNPTPCSLNQTKHRPNPRLARRDVAQRNTKTVRRPVDRAERLLSLL